MRCAGCSSRASSRSRLRARWAPRLVPATACTSSRMTVSTPARASRACEVRIRNSDSGVVMSTSLGVRAKALPLLGRGVTRAHGHGDVGRGKAQPRRRMPDADQRGAQVALDVDREGLHGRDVEDTAALEPLLGDRLARQPVEGPQEGRQGLAGAGGGHDERMVARADRLPGPRLGRGGRAEGAPEPLRGGGGEAVEHISAGTAAGLAVLGGGHWGKRATRHRQPRDRVSPILRP